MAKILRCKDVGVDCDFEARADTEEEILRKCGEHAVKDHGMVDIPQEMIDKVRAAIKDE